jgi:hypothetical protein
MMEEIVDVANPTVKQVKAVVKEMSCMHVVITGY